MDGQARARARLRDRGAGGLRAQALPVPGSAEGLSDLTIRSTVLHKRQGASADGGRRPRGRDRPRAPRGGCGQEHARRRPHRPDRRRRLFARRLQPRRHAARRDRHRAGHPLRRGRAPLPPAAAPDGRRARDLGRGDGEGPAAGRRERLRPPGRLVGAAHALRAEEHELVPLRRPGDRRRGGAADQALRVGRGRRPGDLRLRRRHRDADAEALEGGGGRLPLLPRARPRAGRAVGRARRAASGRAAGEPRCADPPDRGRARPRSRRRPRHGRAGRCSGRRRSRPAPSRSPPRT